MCLFLFLVLVSDIQKYPPRALEVHVVEKERVCPEQDSLFVSSFPSRPCLARLQLLSQVSHIRGLKKSIKQEKKKKRKILF